MNLKKLILILLLTAAFALSASPALAGSAPGTPSSVSISRSDGSLTASWPAVDRAKTYHVTYSADKGKSWSLAALNHPSNTINIGVDNSKTYIVGVRARNESGDSGWRNSPPAGPYVPPVQPPQPPDSVRAVEVSRSDGSLTASWNAAARAETYHVTYSSDKGKSWSLAALDHPSTSIHIAANNAGTYVVGVRAKNGAGGSGWVNSAPTEPFVPSKPGPPPSVTAERGGDGVSAAVSWTAYTGTDFSHYQVIVCTDEQYDGASCSGTVYKSGAFYDADFTGPVSVTGLDAQTGYGVILQTWRKGDAVHKSHAEIPALSGLPVTPDGLTVTPGNGSLTVSWNAVSGATGYDVRSSTNGSSWTIEHSNVSGTSVSVADANGEIERIGVRALNDNGAGPWAVISRAPPNDWLTTVQQGGASIQSAQGQSQLAAPASITVTRDNARDEKLHVSWTAVSGASGYNLACSYSGWGGIGGSGWWNCGSTTSDTSLTVDNDQYGDLSNTRSYLVAVRAVTSNPADASDWKQSERIHPAHRWLSNLTHSRSDGSITLSWTPNPWTTGYQVDCAVHVPGQPAAYTRCATLTGQNDTAAEHSVTISSWTAGGNNYTIDNTKAYDIKITSTNQWGSSAMGMVAPLVDPITLTASNVTGTTATLALANYTGSWWLKPTSPSNAACESMGMVKTKSLSNLTEGSSHTYKAYSDSACTNEIVSAATFTTMTYSSVSNLNAATDGFGVNISSSSSAATAFTTGGNGGGYTLRSVTARFRSVTALPSDSLTVAIHAVSSGDPAASATHTLSGSDPNRVGEYTFTCSGDCSLDANTTYFLVMKGNSGGSRGFTWDTTASTSETNTPSGFGWSIADAAKWYYNSAWTDASGWTGIVKVSATPDPSLTASNVAATSATLTIAHHSGAWWYKSATTGKTTCTSAGSGSSVTVSGLTGGTSYVFTAYSDSSCSTSIAAAASFSTPVTVSTLGGAWNTRHQVGNYLDTQQSGAQAFTTGSNTGGYTLSSIDIRINSKVGSPTNLVVTLHGASGSNPNTSTTLAELSGNSSPPSAGTYTYTCSGSGCNLQAGTTYFVLLAAPSSPGTSYYTVDVTTAAETKEPSDNGWSIADKGRENLYGNWFEVSGGAYKMKVTAMKR